MKAILCFAIILTTFPIGPASAGNVQSLADLAQKETKRRRLLREQGIDGKVITQQSMELHRILGNLGVFSQRSNKPNKSSQSEGKGGGSVKPYRAKLKKLDGEIRRAEDRLQLLRKRLEAERRSRESTMRSGLRQSENSSDERLRWQILELESKLAQLKDDRSETFRDGLKAGFLPGELEGRGIVP